MHKDFSFEDLNFKQETTEHLLYSMIEVLHDAGFRVTTQRKIILEAIAQQVGWHVHPKDVFSYVQNIVQYCVPQYIACLDKHRIFAGLCHQHMKFNIKF